MHARCDVEVATKLGILSSAWVDILLAEVQFTRKLASSSPSTVTPSADVIPAESYLPLLGDWIITVIRIVFSGYSQLT